MVPLAILVGSILNLINFLNNWRLPAVYDGHAGNDAAAFAAATLHEKATLSAPLNTYN
jgi:hypothetical protein